jgi:tetratricopeptide (TPR) repeat protein
MVAAHRPVEVLKAIDQHVGIEEPASAAPGLQFSLIGFDFGPVVSQCDRALEFLNRIVALDGGADASLQKLIADLTGKKFDHALKQLDTTSPEYNDKVAQIKADKQTYQLEECKSRADKYPTDLQIRFELGQLYYEAGKIAEAQPEFQKAQANPHRKLAAMTFLAKCFAARGMNDLAAKRLQDALKEKLVFDEEKKELVYSLGVIFDKMGKKDESIEQFKMIYEIDSAYKDVPTRVEDNYSAAGTSCQQSTTQG